MKNKFIAFGLLVLLSLTSLALLAEKAEAIGVGVSPSYQYIPRMLRNGSAESYFFVSVGSDKPVSVSIGTRGDIAKWIEFPNGTNFQVDKNNPKRVRFIVKPPANTANGEYSGIMTFTTSSLGETGEGIGSSIRASVEAKVTVQITDQQFLLCEVSNLQVGDAEINQPLLLSFSVQNDGNVRVRPQVDVAVWNQKQDKIEKTFNLDSGRDVLPTTSDNFFFPLSSSGLELGQYWAEVSINPCDKSDFLTFDVLKEGSLKLDGIFVTIMTNVKADIGEVTPITAVFQNIGESPVKAKFKGQVLLGGKIVQLLESEEQLVQVGETANITTYFTPKSPGRYNVKGKVLYGNKETFENTGVINVLGTVVNYPVIILYSIIALLLAFIIYRLYRRNIRAY